jgi:hypothetical protein
VLAPKNSYPGMPGSMNDMVVFDLGAFECHCLKSQLSGGTEFTSLRPG